MSTSVQHRRGTTLQHAAFTGNLGEITMDTDKKTLVVHDGATAGGIPLVATNNGQLAGLRNVLHNGDFRIAQRTLPSSVGGYSIDRWFVNNAGTALGINTYGPATNMTTSASSIVMSLAGAVGNTDSNVEQRIESANCRHLAGKIVTVSYWLYQNSGVTKNITTGFGYATAIDNFGVVTAGPSSATQAIPTATWTKVTYTVALAATAVNGIRLTCGAGMGAIVAGQSWSIGDVQLELGSVANPFEVLPISVQLALCQRYYQTAKSSLGGYTVAGCVNQYQGSFAVPMRISPTATLTASSNSNTTVANMPTVDANGWQHTSTGVAAGSFTSTATGAFSADL